LGSNPVKLEPIGHFDMNARKIIRKRRAERFYPRIELLFGQLLRQLVNTGLPQSLSCVWTRRGSDVGRRRVIQNETNLWISSILNASEPALSKIYPQLHKKSSLIYPSLQALREESLVMSFN
jgi:hypothetical protein